jgi:hypothetical protein
MNGLNRYYLKAAVADYEQLDQRARVMKSIGLNVSLELHTFGKSDVYSANGMLKCVDNIARLREEYGDIELKLHVPPPNIEIMKGRGFDLDQVYMTLELMTKLSCSDLVLHRYQFLNDLEPAVIETKRMIANSIFNKTILQVAKSNLGINFLVENVGFFWFLPKNSWNYVVTVLDNFFPWELNEFVDCMLKENGCNVFPMVDSAHSVLSSNMFNLLKHNYNLFRDDRRFLSILDSDLERADSLSPLDYINPAVPYYHLSDSWLIDKDSIRKPLSDSQEFMRKALTTEGLGIGSGNIDWCKYFPTILDMDKNSGKISQICLEVEPGIGEDHVNNFSQFKSLNALRSIISKHENGEIYGK